MNIPAVRPTDGQNQDRSYEPMLRESIDHFLAEYHNGTSDLSAFGCIFSRLVQTMPDPPVEIIWFYSAATFHTWRLTFQDPRTKVFGAKDLFRLLVSCSNPCNGLKKMAVLAPVVGELYRLVWEFWGKELSLKREIESLVEGVVNYISICYDNVSREQGIGLDNVMVCFEDLVQVWMVDKSSGRLKYGDNLRLFFPLLIDEVRPGFSLGCRIGCVAAAVLSEALLLRLCLRFGLGVSREELHRNLQDVAVQTIRGFRNCSFLDMLLRMLLEPSLPVTTLLSSEDEILLRKVLYDAVILVDYSILSYGAWSQLQCCPFKDLALMWLLVADSAVELASTTFDQTSVLSYINAFSGSHLPNHLIKWIYDRTGLEKQIQRPIISTPRALIKWLLMLEDQGLTVFDHDMQKFHAKAVICKSMVGYEPPNLSPYGRNLNGAKNGGDKDMFESNGGLSANMCRSDLTDSDSGRKRKEEMEDQGEMPFKLVKYNFHENSVVKKIVSSSIENGFSDTETPVHGLNSGNEVNNTVSDENMEEMTGL